MVFDAIDEVLPAERGPYGEPSAGDFVANELPSIVERFAVDFDALPAAEGLAGLRELIAPGIYVRVFAAYGMLLTDDTVELTSISLEPFEPT
jgi:hypothetical protein